MLARRSCTTIALSLGIPCREELVDGVCRGGARAVGNVCAELEAEAFEDLAEVVCGRCISSAVWGAREGRKGN